MSLDKELNKLTITEEKINLLSQDKVKKVLKEQGIEFNDENAYNKFIEFVIKKNRKRIEKRSLIRKKLLDKN